MPRIPINRFEVALITESNDLTDMIILNGPCYLLVVDGEVNIVYDVDQYKVVTAPLGKLLKYLRNQPIPNIWK